MNERGFVDYISLPPRLYGSLAELLRHPTLQRVERITIDGANGEAPLASLATLPLTTLHLKNVTIPSGPNSIPTLQRLDLTECVAEDDVLAAFLIAATGLQNLYLPGTKVGPRTLEAILTLPHLDSVRIDGLSEHDAMRVRKRIPTAVLE